MVPVSNGTYDGDGVLPDLPYVLEVGRLEECVDAGEVRQFAAAEAANRAIVDRRRTSKAQFERTRDLGCFTGATDLALLLKCPRPLQVVALISIPRHSVLLTKKRSV